MITALFGTLAGIAAVPLLAKHGEIAPDFSAHASLAGKSFKFSLKEALNKGAVVVYFYPSAYTGGCNVQAHTFATKMDEFTKAKSSVIGVSMDNIERLNDFSADPDYCAGKVAVASDPSGEISKSYGLKLKEEVEGAKDTRGQEIGHGFVERVTFVVASDGKIAAMIEGVSPSEHVEKALAEVQRLNSKK